MFKSNVQHQLSVTAEESVQLEHWHPKENFASAFWYHLNTFVFFFCWTTAFHSYRISFPGNNAVMSKVGFPSFYLSSRELVSYKNIKFCMKELINISTHFYNTQYYFSKVKMWPNSEYTLLHQSLYTWILFLSAKLDNFSMHESLSKIVSRQCF